MTTISDGELRNQQFSMSLTEPGFDALTPRQPTAQFDIVNIWWSYQNRLLTHKGLLIALSKKVEKLSLQTKRETGPDAKEMTNILREHESETAAQIEPAIVQLVAWLDANDIILVDT